jgi:transposase
LTTKVVALADALGNLVRFVLLPGQRHDSLGVERLITDIEFAALIADKAFDNNAIRAELNERGALAVIPSKGDRKTFIPHDAEMYNIIGDISSRSTSHDDSQDSVVGLMG